jgi:hypothetical protein
MSRVWVASTFDELRGQFQSIIEQAEALGGRHDAIALGQRPKPDSWSAAECLAHLNLSADPYLAVWRPALQTLRERSPRGPVRDRHRRDFWGWSLVWTLEPPPRFRFQTTQPFQPVDVRPIEAIVPAFLQRQRQILEVLDSADGLPVDTVKITSAFDARVRYSIWSSFCVTASHERRHVWQAERALQALGSR